MTVTMPTTDITLTVAPQGIETGGDERASKANQLANVLACQAVHAIAGLERALTFLGTDYIRPEASDPATGLVILRQILAVHPERVEAVRADALRFRFEAFQAPFDGLMQRLEAEIADANELAILTTLCGRLEQFANEARSHWPGSRRELAINALRRGLAFAERAYQPLDRSSQNGKGDPDRTKREAGRRARQLARSVGPKGPSNPSGPQRQGKSGKRGRGK